jgi:hypothetical protein
MRPRICIVGRVNPFDRTPLYRAREETVILTACDCSYRVDANKAVITLQ